jgi:hypothetical protein
VEWEKSRFIGIICGSFPEAGAQLMVEDAYV